VSAIFSTFPAGIAGIALLMLRISIGAALVICAVCIVTLSIFFKCLLVLVAASLAIGFVTPLSALVSALVMGIAFAESPDGLRPLLLLHALSAVALALLGAGAYSLDARMFGRRVIELGR
jgi:hypothetical protein